MEIWTLVITDNFATTVTLHPTQEAAEQELYRYIRVNHDVQGDDETIQAWADDQNEDTGDVISNIDVQIVDWATPTQPEEPEDDSPAMSFWAWRTQMGIDGDGE